MRVTVREYREATGWSERFPDWGSRETMVLVFGAPEYAEHPQPITSLVSAFPHAQVIGCSTAGEIYGTCVRDESLSVAVVDFEHSMVRSAWAEIEDGSSSSIAGAAIAEELVGEDLAGVLVLSEGLNVNGTELARGITGTLGEAVVVTGGLAGDGDRFGSTWVLADGAIRHSAVTAVGIYGDAVRMGYGFKGGWDFFGPERLVTRSSGNVLFELDDRAALDLYEQYLGELAKDLPASGLLFPLALREPSSEQQLVRTILAVDRDARSLTFAGDIPEGAYAQLMKANFDRLIEGAESAVIHASVPGSVSGNSLSVAISCVGRRLVLGDRVEEEVEATVDALPEGVEQVGFYSYGELSPGGAGSCELHNQTRTLTKISERGGF